MGIKTNMQCKICSNSFGNNEFQVPEMMYGTRELFDYFQCSVCRCLQIKEIPENISKYYAGEYYSYQSVADFEKQSMVKKYLIKTRNKRSFFGVGLLGSLLNLISTNKTISLLSEAGVNVDSKILDVGCGAGGLLYALNDIGFSNLFGIDPFNKEDLNYSNGLVVKKMDLHEVTGDWDFIMLNHSFEHMPKQKEVLDYIYDLLRPGALCMIRIPVVSSYAWEHYSTNWVQLDAPRHFFLHSKDSMDLLAAKSKFIINKIIFDSTAFQIWGSEQYCAGIPLRDNRSYSIDPSKSIFTRKDINHFTKQAKSLNEQERGDQAAFFLQKA